jgi:hypothetical protein
MGFHMRLLILARHEMDVEGHAGKYHIWSPIDQIDLQHVTRIQKILEYDHIRTSYGARNTAGICFAHAILCALEHGARPAPPALIYGLSPEANPADIPSTGLRLWLDLGPTDDDSRQIVNQCNSRPRIPTRDLLESHNAWHADDSDATKFDIKKYHPAIGFPPKGHFELGVPFVWFDLDQLASKLDNEEADQGIQAAKHAPMAKAFYSGWQAMVKAFVGFDCRALVLCDYPW